MIMDFLVLLFAHLLADYPLQGPFLSEYKGSNKILLFTHAGIWTGIICITATFLGYNIDLVDVIFLFIVHSILDYCKSNNVGIYSRLDPLKEGLLLDQLLHVGQIILLILLNLKF